MNSIDVYAPGCDLTARATAPVTAGRFVKISGNRADSVIAVTHADPGGRIAGVTRDDANTNDLVALARSNSRVVKVAAGGAISAFAEVEVGAAGKAVTKSAGIAVGYATTGAANDTAAEISLY